MFTFRWKRKKYCDQWLWICNCRLFGNIGDIQSATYNHHTNIWQMFSAQVVFDWRFAGQPLTAVGASGTVIVEYFPESYHQLDYLLLRPRCHARLWLWKQTSSETWWFDNDFLRNNFTEIHRNRMCWNHNQLLWNIASGDNDRWQSDVHFLVTNTGETKIQLKVQHKTKCCNKRIWK